MNKIRCLALLGAFVVLATSLGRTQEKKFGATPISYEGLKQEILKQRGKVVIVDFWSTTCPPCRAAFHKFVKMSKEHENKGVVVVSVSLDAVDRDDPDETADKVQQRIDKFLNDEQATMRNLWVDGSTFNWQNKLGARSIPCYFVFDRQGRWVRFNGGKIDYAEIEQTALKMAQEK